MNLAVWLPALFVLRPASMGAANVAFDAYERLGLRDFMDFEAQSPTPPDRCVTLRSRRHRRLRNTRYRAARYGPTRAGLPPAGTRQLS